MPIKCKESKAVIDRAIEEQANRFRRVVLRTLQYIGELAVTTARTTSMKGRDFRDQTGNLRSSMGYVIAYNGKVMNSAGFTQVNSGAQGAMNGKSLAERLANEVSKGYVLVVVAGMKYATYVSAKGYDVLDSAENTAEKLAKQLLSQLKG